MYHPAVRWDCNRRLWAGLGTVVLLTLTAYAVVSRLLRPLQAIGDGAARFGRGDFAAPIVTAHNDELADLAA